MLLAWCAILLAGSIILVGFYLLHEWITPYLNSHLSYETRYSLSEYRSAYIYRCGIILSR